MLRKVIFALIGLVIVVACIFASAYYRLYIGDSMERSAGIREILEKAKSVTAYEYATVMPAEIPTYSQLLTEKNLLPTEVGKIVEAFSATGKLPRAMCFEPHHLLQCTLRDGSVQEIHICFECSEIQVGFAAPSGMSPWSAALKCAFANCGLPVRPDRYRVGRSANTDSPARNQNP